MTIQEPGSSPFPLPQEVIEAAFTAHREVTGGEPANYIAFMAGLLAGVVTDRGLQAAARILQTSPALAGRACVCGDIEEGHDLKNGIRTACSAVRGHTGIPCDCKTFVAKEEP